MSKADREALIAQRRAKVVEHIKAGLTAEEIADTEGLDVDDARKTRGRIAKEDGIVVPPSSRSDSLPIGVDDRNHQFRIALGNELSRLRDIHHQITVAHMTGLTQAEQREAMIYSPAQGHNWTVGQMQRLADARGISFEELLTQAMKFTK